ncbi:MAG: copper chaperone PCu(A)C [Rickettsiaceae bacterium]|nr:MAG: copper chaperone PCu(A)C [Rickettsiaceae bacterium]
MSKKSIVINGLFLLCGINFSIADVYNRKLNNENSSLEQSKTEKQNDATLSKIIEIKNPWARPSLSPNKNSAIYLKVKNNSSTPYALVKASSMVANNVELHQSYIDENKINRMATINKIVIPANSEVELAPGGIHIMLIDLKQALREGDKFKVSLKFETDSRSDNGASLNLEQSIDVEVKLNNYQ